MKKLMQIIEKKGWDSSLYEKFINNEKSFTVWEDYSNYDERFCNNGGSYGFWDEAVRVEKDFYIIKHFTTADLPYCDACGVFASHAPHACEYQKVDFRDSTPETVLCREFDGYANISDLLSDMSNMISLSYNMGINPLSLLREKTEYPIFYKGVPVDFDKSKPHLIVNHNFGDIPEVVFMNGKN